MSERPNSDDPDAPAREPELDPSSEQAVRALLRGALAEPEQVPDLTRGVQQRIRVQSRGKFYADGWSTVKHPPLNTYLVTSLMMLLVLFAVYATLAPLSGAPDAPPRPKPVQVLPPP